MTAPDDATLAQRRAADPGASTWLSANAGSGKTRVLTDRVARLLLRGTPPQNILCLTYTKAAAGEMQNRLFRRLGEWAMLGDADLARRLSDLGVAGPFDLGRTRTLFARAIETPGGLKIQTIHSFCAALLRQFPLEAGVSPRFQEMDESARRHLVGEILEDLARDDPDGAVSGLARIHTGEDVVKLAEEIAGAREAFGGPAEVPAILRETGLPAELSEASILRETGLDPGLFGRLLDVCRAGSANDVKAAEKLARIDPAAVTCDDLPILETLFLYGDGTKTSVPFTSKAGRFPTAASRDALGPADCAALDALMDRTETVRALRLGLEAARRTAALRAFAGVFLPAYARAKSDRGWLDFDDLIGGARRLLNDSASAEWVLYRIDGGIDHVLVDEAQDTSPAQWAVIEALVREFGAGEGARAPGRTLFVVGDPKQSIYSFQGADAEAFEAMRKAFASRLIKTGGLANRALLHSFRSSPAILSAVDAAFADRMEAIGGPSEHLAQFPDLPGRVDLWPLIPKPETPDPGDWTDPVDSPAPENPASLLAERIADELHRMIHVDRETIPCQEKGRILRRPVTAGDVLILVQGRTGSGELFHAIIRALKNRGLAVAGADRLRIGAELAVRDLTALCAFLALPEDSLSLAAALRSPLFGWSEDALYRLAAERAERHLWQTLRGSADHADTRDMLDDLRTAADFLRPHDLLERILVRHDGRRRLLARLGVEARDGIDELLNQALNYERQEVPSLTGFLAWLDRETGDIKRQAESGAGQIQVMTVHGAKGLERPVVILPDTLRGAPQLKSALLTGGTDRAHWKPARTEAPPHLAALAAATQARAAAERQRLLYVAMTRAETWLIACGAGDAPKSGGTWYDDIAEGMDRAGAAPQEFGFGTGLRLASGVWEGVPAGSAPEPPAAPEPLPGWATRPAPAPTSATAGLAPSGLGGAKALPGETGAASDTEAALRRGRQLHLLLEHLPGLERAERREVAVALLAHGEDAADAAAAAALAGEVGALIDDPALAALFDPDAMAEVDVSAALPELGGRRIHGAIDRLIVAPDRVTAVDFKTNALVPRSPGEVPDGLLRQMGAYLSALRLIWPDREAEVAILWTAERRLMPLSHDIVMDALTRTSIS